jgi:lysosomal alpha-mannosidase|tara:strand:- start:322 stop:621 length:300 start_codon:yes stop_codon:yes gene_type:complete
MEDYVTNYATNQLMLLFGMDFNFMNAYQNYENMDKMIEFMNKNHGDKYIFKYSTPSNYVKDLNKIDRVWPHKVHDLMPLGDYFDDWWTGYFSSKANNKA